MHINTVWVSSRGSNKGRGGRGRGRVQTKPSQEVGKVFAHINTALDTQQLVVGGRSVAVERGFSMGADRSKDGERKRRGGWNERGLPY